MCQNTRLLRWTTFLKQSKSSRCSFFWSRCLERSGCWKALSFCQTMGLLWSRCVSATQSNKVSWTVAAAAGLEWAKKVFPNAASDRRSSGLLWDQIFKTCRITKKIQLRLGKNMQLSWRARRKCLTRSNFQLFTTQHLELIWHLACLRTTCGNQPELSMLKAKVSCQICQQKRSFTAPDFRRADGYVTSTKTS